MIYLSGTMMGLARDEWLGWRLAARSHFDGRGIETFIPDDAEETEPALIVARDLDAMARSRVLLVRAGSASWGTAMEIHHFHSVLRRPVVAFADSSQFASHWLRHHCHHLTTNWDDALAVAEKVWRSGALF